MCTRTRFASVVLLAACAGLALAQAPAARPAQEKQGKPKSNNLGKDARGNPLRLAFKTGCEPTAHRLLSKCIRPPPSYRSPSLREPTAAAWLGVG
jgi:hypothetical protein